MSYAKRDEDSGNPHKRFLRNPTKTWNTHLASRLFVLGDVNVFSQINKSTVLQEARAFNDSPINVRKCRLLLTKIVYLLSLGEPFNAQEATDLFFNVIKLFQSKDVSNNRRQLALTRKGSSYFIDFPQTNDVFGDQGAFRHCSGCDYGHSIFN